MSWASWNWQKCPDWNFLKIGSWNFTSCCWEPCTTHMIPTSDCIGIIPRQISVQAPYSLTQIFFIWAVFSCVTVSTSYRDDGVCYWTFTESSRCLIYHTIFVVCVHNVQMQLSTMHGRPVLIGLDTWAVTSDCRSGTEASTVVFASGLRSFPYPSFRLP